MEFEWDINGFSWVFMDMGEYYSMDWFKGKFMKIYRKPPYLMVKTMVSCRFSLKPIH